MPLHAIPDRCPHGQRWADTCWSCDDELDVTDVPEPTDDTVLLVLMLSALLLAGWLVLWLMTP